MSEALITALVALIDSRIAANSNAAAQVQLNPQPQGLNTVASAVLGTVAANPAATPVASDPFGGLSNTGMTAGTVAPVTEVTPKMIQELIIPLLANEGAKIKLQQAMQELGIVELPAARPDQLPALYAKFKAVSDEVNGVGLSAAPAAPAAGGMTII